MRLLKYLSLALVVSASLFVTSLAQAAQASSRSPENEWVFVTSKKGVQTYRLNLKTGAFVSAGQITEVSGASFIAIHPNRRFLYTVNSAKFSGKNSGAVSSFSIDAETGKLTFLNQQPSAGGPTHLALDSTGKNLLVANYSGGTVVLFPIQDNGQIGESSVLIQHEGSSIHPQRQNKPYAHFITADPANRFALACDLGIDKVLVYKLDAAKHSLTPNDPPSASLKPGAGPRHLAFQPDGRSVYVINELDSTLTAFHYDTKKGTLQEFQNISTLPKDFTEKNYPAEVAVHPSGKFVYGSNRGQNSIVVFAVDRKTGLLEAIAYESTQGKTPRHFEIDPTGTYLLAANQDTSNVVVFRIDQKTGHLQSTGTAIEAENPSCVKFILSDK